MVQKQDVRTGDRDKLTEAILGAAFEVANALGHSFVEVVYRRALAFELRLRNISCRQEVPFSVIYKGESAGQYVADMVVDERVIVELKAVDNLTSAHSSQTINYLHASGIRVALLINFGTPRLQYKRIVV